MRTETNMNDYIYRFMNAKSFRYRLAMGGTLFFALALMGGEAMAQVKLKRNFESDENIAAFENTTFCTAFLNEKGALYTLRDIAIVDISDIDKIAFNPTGSSLALIRDDNNITIYSFRERNVRLFELKDKRKGLKDRKVLLPSDLEGTEEATRNLLLAEIKKNKKREKGEVFELGRKLNLTEDQIQYLEKGKLIPLAMCYAPDARHFVASNSLGEIIIYDTRAYEPQAYIQGKALATVLAMSSNNYFIAAGTGKNLDIWNFQTKELRKSIPMTGQVIGLDFSADASQLAVVTDDNCLTILDTKTWGKVATYDKLGGELASPSFHPDGKYVSVVKDRNAILIVNLKNGAVEQTLEEKAGGVLASRFFINRQNSEVFMLSNRPSSLVFWDANGLNPFYGKLLSDEVDARMNEWVKMMQGESMEEYAIRVNDETRLKQQQLFAQEVATELAGDRLAIENPFVGEYDAASNKLNIGFNTLPSIAIDVPEGEQGDFKDGHLKFNNAVYVLNDKDEFELAYVEVLNETTNKVYIYDNIGRTKLTALEADDNFVPLEIMQQANREEVQLQEIKEAVVEEKKQDKLITENTQIDVKTEVQADVDANGNKIYNYKVSYQYEVINKAFSAKEDFPSGGYDIERSNAAMSLMKIIKNAFEGDFSKYLSEGKQVKIIITGSADASPIRGRIAYGGQYGEFVNEPYYKDGNLDNITVTKASGITTNEQLALLRAAGVKDYVEKNVTTLQNTNNQYEFHVEVAKERGGEFRKINVQFVIVDAFHAK